MSVSKVAECNLDIFRFLVTGERLFLNQVKLRENKCEIATNEKYAVMDIIDGLIDDSPKLEFFVKIRDKSIAGLRETIDARSKYFSTQFSTVKKEIERYNTKLVQHIAAFSGVGFDETRIYVVAERRNTFACFSACSTNKKRKACSIF